MIITIQHPRVEKAKLRTEYTQLLVSAMSIISTLDVRNKRGEIIESGATFIDAVLIKERRKKDISEQIQIIGEDKWTKLKQIWKRMRIIEERDKVLISTMK